MNKSRTFSPPNKILTDIDEALMVGLYLQGKSAKDIIKFLNNKVKTTKTVYDILRKYNIKTRSKYENTKINHNAFKEINTEASAYFLGLMVADGWVQSKTNSLGIDLKEDDEYILHEFKNFLQTDRNVMRRKSGTHQHILRMCIDSPIIKADLAKYGVVPNKSFISKLPDISNEMMPYFLRGLLDGDGCVHKTPNGKVHIIFYATERLCSEIQDFLCETLNITKNKIISQESIYSVRWANQTEANKLARYLYPNPSTKYKLERKFLTLQDIL